MKKVIVIGAGSSNLSTSIMKVLETAPRTEIVIVNNVEDIKTESNPFNMVERVYELTNLNIDSDPYIDYEPMLKGKKGYQRPYKYHR